MLTVKKSITITGNSTIDGTIAESFSVSLAYDDPKNIRINSVQVNKELAKENYKTCREDRIAFEAQAYEIQDELIAAAEETEAEETEETDSDSTETGETESSAEESEAE